MYDCFFLPSTSSCYSLVAATKFHETIWNLKHPQFLPKPKTSTIFKNHIKAKATSVEDDFANFFNQKKTTKLNEKKQRSHFQEFVKEEDSNAARIEFLEFGSSEDKLPVEDLHNLEVQQNPNAENSEISISKRRRNTSGRQILRRSSILAKQVICVESALSLGFVSQLWVDVDSFRVLVIEVRPNLLSGEIERILLEDVMQVGDVLLVEDESVVETEFKLAGLETLVGYSVVTPAGQKIGKVRGYSFNIDSGGVESLELDSFGMSILPSSLVSTYALFTEDVLEVGSDTVVVHEDAMSRIQRLTKGLWGNQRAGKSIDEIELPEFRREQAQSDSSLGRNKSFSSKKLRKKVTEAIDKWELPMDYL